MQDRIPARIFCNVSSYYVCTVYLTIIETRDKIIAKRQNFPELSLPPSIINPSVYIFIVMQRELVFMHKAREGLRNLNGASEIQEQTIPSSVSDKRSKNNMCPVQV